MYLLFDGGNGGHTSMQGYGSFIIRADKNSPILHHERVTFDRLMTNNEAEYATLIYALQWISDHYDDPEYEFGALTIEGDSELVRNQVLGNWRVRQEHLKPLHKRATELLNHYTGWAYYHVSRKYVVDILGH